MFVPFNLRRRAAIRDISSEAERCMVLVFVVLSWYYLKVYAQVTAFKSRISHKPIIHMKEIRLLNADEIDARVATVNQKGCSLLLYKDARCDMRLLDETFGSMNWTRSHEVIDGNLYCNVSVWDEEKKMWITKQDVGVESYTEKEKGQASDAFKRACFNFGIGRELYTAPFIWVNLTNDDLNAQGKIKTTFKVQSIGYNEKREINRLVIVDNKRNVRYEMGKVIKPKEEPNNIDNDMLAMALQEIKSAQSLQTLTQIYNNYEPLHGNDKFMSSLSARKKLL